MNEIEKLYENAGINKREIENCTYKNSTPCGHSCDDDEDCPYLEIKEDYPPFTAKKQIELIKWLIASEECYFAVTIKPDEFEEYLAKYINNMWKDLADIDKKQIKDILK